MKKYIETIKKSILGGLVFGITILGVAYAANITTITTQTINSGDTISKDWYQEVNDKLNTPSGINGITIEDNAQMIAGTSINSFVNINCSRGIAISATVEHNNSYRAYTINNNSCTFIIDNSSTPRKAHCYCLVTN